MTSLALVAALLSAVGALELGQMNPVDYLIANPRHPTRPTRKYRGEYFEILGPATSTQYSEVHWSAQTMPIPHEIVEQFDNRVMAVTGYEADIVRVGANGEHVSVPCTEQYNHHYTGFMHGKAVTQVDSSAASDAMIGPHGGKLPSWEYTAEWLSGAQSSEPQLCEFGGLWINPANSIRVNVTTAGPTTHQYQCSVCEHVYDPVKDGNGTAFEDLPDSWKCPVCGAPRSAYKPMTSDNGRTVRWVHDEPAPTSIAFNASCIGPVGWKQGYGMVSVGDLVHPQGSATLHAHDELSINSTGLFGTSKAFGAPVCSMIIWSDGNTWYRPQYLPEETSIPTVQAFSEGNGNEHRGSFHGYARGYAQLIHSPTTFINSPMIINVNKKLTGETTTGPIASLLPQRSLAPPNASYSGILECPCTTRKIKIVERYLLKPTSCPLVTIDATSVPSAVNTLTECQAAAKMVCEGKNITPVAAVRSTIDPPGCTVELSGGKCLGKFNNLTESPKTCSAMEQCVCRDPTSTTGSIGGQQFNRGVCAPSPTSQLLETNNAICNISAYEGGLHCCSGGTMLLDADQEVPDATDTYHLKYRFYYENYTNQSNLYRVWWSTEATNNEYDVPQSTANCQDPHTPGELCVHTIKSQFQGKDLLNLGSGCMVQPQFHSCLDPDLIATRDNGWFKLVYAAGHCHAPSCQSMELWDTDKNELICRNDALIGSGGSLSIMNETGFVVAIPPCVWGDSSEELFPPPLIHLDSNLTIIKRSNSTYGHWGVMALWQSRATYAHTKH